MLMVVIGIGKQELIIHIMEVQLIPIMETQLKLIHLITIQPLQMKMRENMRM